MTFVTGPSETSLSHSFLVRNRVPVYVAQGTALRRSTGIVGEKIWHILPALLPVGPETLRFWMVLVHFQQRVEIFHERSTTVILVRELVNGCASWILMPLRLHPLVALGRERCNEAELIRFDTFGQSKAASLRDHHEVVGTRE
jgi:hypothetical protein